jgi:hypothetical protein
MKPRRWKILVIWRNGEREFVKSGAVDSIFTSRAKAQEMAEFFQQGFDPLDIQSINVVPA